VAGVEKDPKLIRRSSVLNATFAYVCVLSFFSLSNFSELVNGGRRQARGRKFATVHGLDFVTVNSLDLLV